MKNKLSRKYAAIMFTDIVGYTELTSSNEEKALSLVDKKRDLLLPLIKKYNGKLIKEMGDGTLSTYYESSNAIACANIFQSSTDEELKVRAGIHYGDVIVKNEDVFGDVVNIASRLESLAQPKSVLVSKETVDNLENEGDLEFVYLGLQSLKGVGRLIEVYALKDDRLYTPDPEDYRENQVKKHSGNEVPSIAIIPFENKGSKEDTFYAYGISADLISDCNSAGIIRVIPLKDIEKLDYSILEYKELSNKLSARYIAQGALWKMGDMFQLSIELYDNKDEKLLWSDRWQESWENLPSIKNNLSDGLLKALNTKPKEENKEDTSNSDAYEYYLKAVFKWEKRELVNDTIVVRELLNKSIEIDDDFLLAKNLLGKTFLVMGDYDDAMQIFSSALKQAEKLDDKKNLVRSLNSIGEIYLIKEGNKDRALKYFEKSLSISRDTGDKSGMGDCYEKLGSVYGENSEFLKSIEYFEKSLAIFNELDNKNMVISSINNIGVTYYRKNEYDKSLEYFEKQLKMVKELGWKSGIAQAHSNIAFIYNSKGDYRKAIELHQKALDIYEKLDEKRSTSHTLYSIGHLYFNIGELDKALELFFRSSKMNEETGVKPMIARDYNRIGAVYYEKGNYTEAEKFIDDCLSIHKELDEKVHFSITTAHLHICYKHLGKEYDNNELNNFINHFNIDEIPDRDNFILYKVLGNKSCLKAGYNQICKIANAMEDDLKEQFLNYPNSKRIIEEYEKVFN